MHVYNLTYSTAVPINSHTDRLEYTTSRRLVIIILFKLSKLRLRLRPLELKSSKYHSDLAAQMMYRAHLEDYYYQYPVDGALVLTDYSEMAGWLIL